MKAPPLLPPLDLRPVAPSEAGAMRFLVSPRYLHAVQAPRAFAIVGYGPMTALEGRPLPHREFGLPLGGLPEAIAALVSPPVVGLDLVVGAWSRSEPAIVVPEGACPVDLLAEGLDRRWYWVVDGGGQVEVVDRHQETRTAVGPMHERVGPVIYRDLECAMEDGYPMVYVRVGRAPFRPVVAFVPGPVDADLFSNESILRVLDPTPSAGAWLTGERIESLVDRVKLALGPRPVLDLLLNPTTRLCVTGDRSVLPFVESRATGAALERAFRRPRVGAPAIRWNASTHVWPN